MYIGSTNDLRKRLEEHNSGKAVSTKFRKPFELRYYEAYKSEEEARKREHNLKLRGNAYNHLIMRIRKSLN